MRNFKIVFPTRFINIDKFNDNIDVNIITENGDVYFATIFTVENIRYLMNKNDQRYFWADSMVVVDELDINSIYQIISEIVDDKLLNVSFDFIGKSFDVFGRSISFDSIVNLGGLPGLNYGDE